MDSARPVGAVPVTTAADKARVAFLVAMAFVIACPAHAQTNERAFPQSKAAIEKVLKEIPTSGRLPVLDGFATSSDHAIERYQRGYYQTKFQVAAAPSGGSVVRVSVQVTAWYADPVTSKSGYQLLTSNGRLESDVLDQLADQLAADSPRTSAPVTTATAKKPAISAPPADEPVSAPVPRLPQVSSSLSQGLSQQERDGKSDKSNSGKTTSKPLSDGGPLQTEADSLEEIIKNQGHPKESGGCPGNPERRWFQRAKLERSHFISGDPARRIRNAGLQSRLGARPYFRPLARLDLAQQPGNAQQRSGKRCGTRRIGRSHSRRGLPT